MGTQARQAREAQASISSADSYLECLLAGGRMDWLNTGWGTALPLLPCPSCATGSRGLVVGFYRGTRARPVCQDLRACWPAYLAARCAPGHARVYHKSLFYALRTAAAEPCWRAGLMYPGALVGAALPGPVSRGQVLPVPALLKTCDRSAQHSSSTTFTNHVACGPFFGSPKRAAAA